jgi:ribA/ribD-fused uncharacterized protein
MSWLKDRKYRREAEARIHTLANLLTRTHTGEILWEMDPQDHFGTASVYDDAPGRWALRLWLADDGSADTPRLEFIPEGSIAYAVAMPDCTPASTAWEEDLLRELHEAVIFQAGWRALKNARAKVRAALESGDLQVMTGQEGTGTVIPGFRGRYRCFSNYFMTPVVMNAVTYPSNEHAFAAAKNSSPGYRVRVLAAPSPGEAKALGRAVGLRPDWAQVRKPLMLHLQLLKFTQHPDLRAILVATGNQVLQEGNTWHDSYWGICLSPGPHPQACLGTGNGLNHLGRILMAARSVLEGD